jgi:PmbA protein
VNKLELQQRLAKLLNEYQRNHRELKGWRFDLHQMRGLEIGLKNNKVGGPYSAPSYKRSISGELYLVWDNHKFTSAKLDSQSVENFNEYMVLWESTAYQDHEGVGIYSPEQIPELNLADGQVKQVIAREIELPFQLLDSGLKRLTGNGFLKIDGKVRCFEDHRVLMNSEGLQVEYDQTPTEFYFLVDDIYGEAYAEMKWPAGPEINRVIENTARVAKSLKNETPKKVSGPVTLLFPPETFEAFLSYYLVTNLHGSLVFNRQSSYSGDDFKAQRQVLREEFSLEINTLLPFRSFSYPCSSEGVPGGAIRLISGGKLQTPLLNLKYAKKFGGVPTPLPSGGKGFFLKSEGKVLNWDDLIRKTAHGLIVYSVLGLHTQDSSSGHFSLTADQCLLVEEGEVVGRIKAIINGDFLGSLPQAGGELGLVAGEDNPGYSFTANAISLSQN